MADSTKPDDAPTAAPEGRLRLLHELWTTSIDAQLRLTQLSARSRQLGIALVASALVLAVLVGRDDALSVSIAGSHLGVPGGVLVLIVSIVALLLLRADDLHHERMRRGVLAFTEDVEEQLRPSLAGIEKGMSQAMAHFARYADATTRRDGSRQVYGGAVEAPSSDRLRRVYIGAAAAPAVAALAMLIAANTGAQGPDVVAGAREVATPEPPTVMASTVPAGVAEEVRPAAEIAPAPVVPTPAVRTTSTRSGARTVAPVATPGAAAKATAGAAKPAEPAAKPTEAKASEAAKAAEPAKADEKPAAKPEEKKVEEKKPEAKPEEKKPEGSTKVDAPANGDAVASNPPPS